MQPHVLVIALGFGALVAPRMLIAQPSLALHAARGSAQGAPWLYGATLGVSSHGLGLRVGGAAGQATPSGIGVQRDLMWVADADVILTPTLWSGSGGRRTIVPYVFVGAGMQPRDGDATGDRVLSHWSWGGGLAIPIFSRASLVGEARSRTLFDREAVAVINTVRRSTELRAGLEFKFGGPSARRASASTPKRKPSVGTIAVPSIPGGAVGTQVLPTARRYLGVKYRYGGTSPSTGFDCSGFVRYVFARHDVRLPRTSREQVGAGTHVEPSVRLLRPGDLMFFAENGLQVSHVAIYTGDSRIIHSTSSGGAVRYDDLASSRGQWFASRLVAARRIASSGPGLADFLRGLETGTVDVNVKILVLDPPDGAPRPR
ncbi:MAG: C40 family peptidase [Gemmatimonadaceae bacterium]